MTFADIRSHSIRGFIDRLELRNCEVFAMGPFAISIVDPTAFLILIDNSQIHRIESQVIHILQAGKLPRYPQQNENNNSQQKHLFFRHSKRSQSINWK